jgi:hypothetical protein
LWDFSPPHFCGCWKLTVSFIATAKTSYTAGTLDEIKTENIRRMRRIRAAQEEYF